MDDSTDDAPADGGDDRHWTRRPLGAVGVAWAGTLAIGGATLASLLASTSWAFDLSRHFTVQYAWGAALLVCMFAWARRPRSAAIAVALVAVNGWIARDVVAQQEPASAGESAVTRVLLANVLTQNQRYGDFVEFVRAERPDVLLLLEVDAEWLEGLAPLEDDYPHRSVRPRLDNFGVAVLSRWPLASESVHGFGDSDHPSIEATVEAPGGELRVLATHPYPPMGRWATGDRDAHLRAVGELAREWGAGTIVAGDFNATPWSPIFGELLKISGLRDTRIGFGNQPTFPSRFPALLRIPIDHVLVSPDVEVVDRRLGPHLGSDHRAVVVDVRLPR